MLCKLSYVFKLNVLELWEFCWFMQNVVSFLPPNHLYRGKDKMTYTTVVVWCLTPFCLVSGCCMYKTVSVK